DDLIAAASIIGQSKGLYPLFWHCHRLLFQHDGSGYHKWPIHFAELKEQSGFFYILLAMTLVPEIKRIHTELGIDESVTRDTCRQIDCFCNNHKIGNDGTPGIFPKQLSWLTHYYKGRLFRIGRFEYKLRELELPIHVFEHNTSHEVVILAPDDVSYTERGLVVNALFQTESFHSQFSLTNTEATGFIITPNGRAINQKVTLDLTKWDVVLKPGDTVLDLHIPSGGAMTPEATGESFTNAFDFFDTIFPDDLTTCIFCNSWIFNTDFEEYFPESNLCRFMSELYIIPSPSNGDDGLFFTFCKDYEDWDEAPRETRLQHAILELYKKDDKLHSSGIIFQRKHLNNFGTQVYRNMQNGTANNIDFSFWKDYAEDG
ncbi:DUF5596 domain-containing protein, partial [bacterium AH-315-E10]|nr:DUF5596 domain-containing protein [bacterium AH-315-E10]